MARQSKAKFTMKGHTLPGINKKSETANIEDGRSPSSAFQQTESPMKSLFGLGSDNKEARQINRDNRQEYRADKKEYRQEKRANNKQHREDMRAYEKDLAGNTSKGNFLTGDPGLTKGEGDYFRDNKADYADEFTQLANKDFKKGKDRRDIVREDYADDFMMNNLPVKGNISNKPTRPEKEKLNYDWKLGMGKNSTAHNNSNPAFKMKGYHTMPDGTKMKGSKHRN